MLPPLKLVTLHPSQGSILSEADAAEVVVKDCYYDMRGLGLFRRLRLCAILMFGGRIDDINFRLSGRTIRSAMHNIRHALQQKYGRDFGDIL